MEISTIIQTIDSEIAKLENVKQLLGGGNGPGSSTAPVKRKPGRPAKVEQLNPLSRLVIDGKTPFALPPKKRKMSAAARKRIGDAQRARWAKLRKAQ